MQGSDATFLLAALRNARVDERERIARALEEAASHYRAKDGTPGPLSSVWGWRTIADIFYREAAKLRALNEDDHE